MLLRLQGIRIAVTDGAAHAVDSSELAFKLACLYAFRDAYSKAKPVILEPIMNVEVSSHHTRIGDIIIVILIYYHYCMIICAQTIHAHTGPYHTSTNRSRLALRVEASST